MKSRNGVIGVGTWIELLNGEFFRIDPRDPWSWFLFPVLTFKEMLD